MINHAKNNFIILGALLAISAVAPKENDKILGKWTNEDASRTLEFVKNGEAYEAIITDADISKYIGKTQISDLKHDKKNKYTGGILYVLQKEMEIDCSARLVGEDKLELKATYGWISKSQTWTKVSSK